MGRAFSACAANAVRSPHARSLRFRVAGTAAETRKTLRKADVLADDVYALPSTPNESELFGFHRNADVSAAGTASLPNPSELSLRRM